MITFVYVKLKDFDEPFSLRLISVVVDSFSPPSSSSSTSSFFFEMILLGFLSLGLVVSLAYP